MVDLNQKRDFLYYEAKDPELLRRAMPPSVISKLGTEAAFLWIGQPEHHHLSFAQVVFTKKEDAIAFAKYFNDYEPEIVRVGQAGSKDCFVPVERDMQVDITYKKGPTHTVAANKDFPGMETYDVDNTVKQETVRETRKIYSVGICGHHLTPELIEQAFHTEVHTAKSLNKMNDKLLEQIESGLALAR